MKMLVGMLRRKACRFNQQWHWCYYLLGKNAAIFAVATALALGLGCEAHISFQFAWHIWLMSDMKPQSVVFLVYRHFLSTAFLFTDLISQ